MSIEEELEDLHARSLFRSLRESESPAGRTITINGRELINFGSNDYLGFANEPSLREAAKAAIDRWGVGAGASRLISGTLSPHVRLEERLAEFKGTEAALSFSSGYAAAVGTLGALLRKDDVVILDKLCHASLIDGARLSGAVMRIFPHNSLERLESHLRWARDHYPRARVVIVTESVFSMDGDSPPLREIVELKNRYNAMLMVDEAHAIGVIGPNGRGLAAHLSLENQIEVQMGTLSKALGTSGGYICGSRLLINLLINRARSFIYSTAPVMAVTAASIAAIDLLASRTGEEARNRLRLNIDRFGEARNGLIFGRDHNCGAIFAIRYADSAVVHSAGERLGKGGFFAPAIRYPTVALHSPRIRITITALHSTRDLDALAELLILSKDPHTV